MRLDFIEHMNARLEGLRKELQTVRDDARQTIAAKENEIARLHVLIDLIDRLEIGAQQVGAVNGPDARKTANEIETGISGIISRLRRQDRDDSEVEAAA